MSCHFLLQGIFPTHESNLCLLHWLMDSLPLCHQGSPSDVYTTQISRLKHKFWSTLLEEAIAYLFNSFAKYYEMIILQRYNQRWLRTCLAMQGTQVLIPGLERSHMSPGKETHPPYSPCSTTVRSPRTAMKTQHHENKLKLNKFLKMFLTLRNPWKKIQWIRLESHTPKSAKNEWFWSTTSLEVIITKNRRGFTPLEK